MQRTNVMWSILANMMQVDIIQTHADMQASHQNGGRKEGRVWELLLKVLFLVS